MAETDRLDAVDSTLRAVFCFAPVALPQAAKIVARELPLASLAAQGVRIRVTAMVRGCCCGHQEVATGTAALCTPEGT